MIKNPLKSSCLHQQFLQLARSLQFVYLNPLLSRHFQGLRTNIFVFKHPFFLTRFVCIDFLLNVSISLYESGFWQTIPSQSTPHLPAKRPCFSQIPTEIPPNLNTIFILFPFCFLSILSRLSSSKFANYIDHTHKKPYHHSQRLTAAQNYQPNY